MVVDDDKQIREGISQGIKWATIGIKEVRAFQDGIDALEAFEEFQPDIVISDVRMPEMSGLEFLKRAKQMRETVRFILVSGYSDFEYVQQAIRLGAVDYELKPINARLLIRKVTELKNEILAEKNSTKLNQIYQLDYKKNTIRKILCGEIEDRNIIKEFFHVYYHVEQFDSFIMLLMESDANRSSESDDVVVIENSLRQCEMKEMAVTNDEKRFIVLVKTVNSVLYAQKRAVDLTKVVRELNATHFEGDLPAVISGIYEVRQIKKAYENMINAMEYKFCAGQGNVYLEEKCRTPLKEEMNLEEKAKELVKAIQTGDGYIEILNELEIYWNKTFSMQANQIKAYLSTVLYQVVGTNEAVISIEEVTRRVEHTLYLSELVEVCHKICEEIVRARKFREESRYSKIIYSAVLYIQENFRENLSVDQVAEHVEKSPNYVSALFKKEVGKSFSTYVNHLRITEAKRLLNETTLLLSEISEEVGYTDYVYFVAVFKKLEGCAPSSFRNKRY